MKHITLIVTLIISVTLIGCGKNVPLSGRVSFADGSLLTTGTVVFDNGKSIARGTIQNDGTYTVGSLSEKDGLPRGEYRVYVQAMATKITGKTKYMENGTELESDVVEYIPLIADKWTKPETSGLTFTADGKAKRFDITVENP